MGTDIDLYVEVVSPELTKKLRSSILLILDNYKIVNDIGKIINDYSCNVEWLLASETQFTKPHEHCHDDGFIFDHYPLCEALNQERHADVLFEEIYDGRNYDLFGVLADVRNPPEDGPISEPKGLPDDVSMAVRMLGGSQNYKVRLDRFDYSKPSWYTLDELNMEDKIWDHCRKRDGGSSDWFYWFNELKEYQNKCRLLDDEIRIIFWFNS